MWRMRRLRGSRGYIGPLGDDFPSIFPLMLGLLVFFSSLYIAYTTYQSKNDTVQCMRANILISRAVRYQVVFDKEYWKKACNLGLSLRGDYQVHLAMWIEHQGKQGWKIEGVCPLDEEFWEDSSDPGSLLYQTKGTRAMVTMTYPVIWRSNEGINVPARLVVVTWR